MKPQQRHISLLPSALVVLVALVLTTSCMSRRLGSSVRSAAEPGLVAPLIINGKEVTATSPYLTAQDEFRNPLARSNLSGEPQKWAAKKALFTEDLFLKGMDFIKKGPSGAYDTPFAVPVEPMAVVLERSWIDDYGQSAARWITVCRAFLKELYSSQNPSVESIKQRLGLTSDEHDTEIRVALERMQSSMYFVGSLVAPNMEDYPFLPITGWDAILSNFDKAEGFNFEVNAGTPSGISNLSAMLESFASLDPEQAALVPESLAADDTFQRMRRVIEESGKAWTGQDGIAVVVSPGEYNGAHPDVASIAMLTGMPLAKERDLFLGQDGYVYLRLPGNQSRKVTAIYSRMEESYLLQHGRLLSQGAVPMIQTWADNAALAQKTGLPLKEGVWYDYVTEGSATNVVGVRQAENGEPLVATMYGPVFDAQPSQKTLLQLVLEKKIYVNLIGGRVIDDKKVFKIIASLGRAIFPNQLVGGPPDTLSDDAYEALESAPEDYVIKRTDRSGGDGVYVLRNLSQDEQKKRVQEVIQSEGQGYTVQRFTPSISQPTVYERSGRWGFSQLLGDLRVFVFVSPDGTPHIGNRGFLYRIAPFDPRGESAPTPWSMPAANTSQGGGYGIILVKGTGSEPRAQAPQEAQPLRWASQATAKRLAEFLAQAQAAENTLEQGRALSTFELERLEYLHKSVMHLLGWKSGAVRAWASRVRANASAENLAALRAAISRLPSVFDEANKHLANVVIAPQGGCSDILRQPPALVTNSRSRALPLRQCLTYAF